MSEESKKLKSELAKVIKENNKLIKEIKKSQALIDYQKLQKAKAPKAIIKAKAPKDKHIEKPQFSHPMLGRRCIVRTFSAGVHLGNVQYANDHETHLLDCRRLWEWDNGGLSLSAIATNGMKGGRVNKCPEIYLTEAIEFIPVNEAVCKTIDRFLEDVEDEK